SDTKLLLASTRDPESSIINWDRSLLDTICSAFLTAAINDPGSVYFGLHRSNSRSGTGILFFCKIANNCSPRPKQSARPECTSELAIPNDSRADLISEIS